MHKRLIEGNPNLLRDKLLIMGGAAEKAIKRDSSTVSCGAEWLFVLKHLERIADYVTNIREQIVYMVRGQVIKHTVW